MRSRVPVSDRRRRGQGGNEIIEFGLLSLLLVPTLIYMFVSGMNLIRLNQGTQVSRDIGDLFIHGIDFSTFDAQSLSARLAQGFNLQVGSFYSGNNAANDGNGGNGLVLLSQVMYIGAGACSALPAGTGCTNQNQYVFTRRLSFGNKGLQFNGTTVTSALGTPTASINSAGYVQSYLTDARAVCPNIGNLFATQLADQQVAYVTETFFSSPDLTFSAIPGGGIYSRLLM